MQDPELSIQQALAEQIETYRWHEGWAMGSCKRRIEEEAKRRNEEG
jgi:hypothetical protein